MSHSTLCRSLLTHRTRLASCRPYALRKKHEKTSEKPCEKPSRIRKGKRSPSPLGPFLEGAVQASKIRTCSDDQASTTLSRKSRKDFAQNTTKGDQIKLQPLRVYPPHKDTATVQTNEASKRSFDDRSKPLSFYQHPDASFSVFPEASLGPVSNSSKWSTEKSGNTPSSSSQTSFNSSGKPQLDFALDDTEFPDLRNSAASHMVEVMFESGRTVRNIVKKFLSMGYEDEIWHTDDQHYSLTRCIVILLGFAKTKWGRANDIKHRGLALPVSKNQGHYLKYGVDRIYEWFGGQLTVRRPTPKPPQWELDAAAQAFNVKDQIIYKIVTVHRQNEPDSFSQTRGEPDIQ